MQSRLTRGSNASCANVPGGTGSEAQLAGFLVIANGTKVAGVAPHQLGPRQASPQPVKWTSDLPGVTSPAGFAFVEPGWVDGDLLARQSVVVGDVAEGFFSAAQSELVAVWVAHNEVPHSVRP